MTSVEQHKLIRELQDHEARMSREDQELFAMFRKRDYDDEDLDEISKKKLLAMKEKYVAKSSKRPNPLDALFGAHES